mgnify:CR=1 FL=1
MLKTITKSAMSSSLVLGLTLISSQFALAAAKCTLNGREVDCAELGNKVKGFLSWGIGGFFVIFALGIWATVFWIMMVVHVIRHNVENKAIWIILMLFTSIVGALIYYFPVKRKFADASGSFRAPTPIR